MKWAAWETLWKRSYHLEAATGKGGLSHLEFLRVTTWSLEPFRKQRIPSKDRSCKIWFNGQKAFLWQDTAGNAQTGTDAHGNSGNGPAWPLGICLSPLFTSLPEFYSTRLHHVRVTPQGSGQPHKQKASSSWSNNQLNPPFPPTETGEVKTGEKWVVAVVLCPGHTSFLLYNFIWVPEMVEIRLLQLQP